MPIPLNQMVLAEIIVNGKQSAAGSSIAPAYNVCHFYRTTQVNPWSNVNIGNAFAASIGAALVAASNARYTPQGVSTRCVNDAQDPPSLSAFAGPGAIGTDSEPSSDAVVLILKTALRGRAWIGRKHFGATSEADTTGDILTGAGLARWQAVQAAYALGFTDANGNVWKPAVLSRTNSQLKVNPTNVAFQPVLQVLLDLNIGTMRRRRTATVR